MSAQPIRTNSGMNRYLHRQEVWEWPIAVYLYLAGMGAGAFAVGLLTDWTVHPDIPSKAALLWGPILVALGAPFLILDLGKKFRFLNARRNPRSSWVARGFLILSTLIVTGLIVFVASLLPSVLPLVGIEVPAWVSNPPPVFGVIEWIALVFAFGTAAYTGVLLKAVKHVKLWDTWFLPLLFLVSAFSTGSMALMVTTLGVGRAIHSESLAGLEHTLMPVEQSLVIIESLVLAAFLYLRHRAQESGTRSVRLLLLGSKKFLFWVGIVGLGILLPVVLENVYSRFPNYPVLLFVTGASVLTGGFLLRLAVVSSGIKEEHPLHKRAALDYDWSMYRKDKEVASADQAERGRG